VHEAENAREKSLLAEDPFHEQAAGLNK